MVPGRRRGAGHRRPHRRGAAEIARHRLSTPGSPRICDEHYPRHPGGNRPRPPRPRPRTEAEVAFLAIGDGAQRWLVEAAASGAARIRSKMARAVELAALVGAARVDEALGLAAVAGRFADADLAAILDHLPPSGRPPGSSSPTRPTLPSPAPRLGRFGEREAAR